MRHHRNEASRARHRPLAALTAALLAFALAFMAFEPVALASAFADEGGQAAGTVQPDAGQQAVEPSGDDGADLGDEAVAGEVPASDAVIPEAGEVPVDAGTDAPASEEGEADARAGPDEDAVADEAAADGVAADEAASDGAAADEVAANGAVAVEGSSAIVRDAPSDEVTRPAQSRAAFASATVTFYSNAASEGPSILARKLVSAKVGETATVDVGDVVAAPPTAVQVFDGWLYGGAVHTDAIAIDPQDGNVRLYPAFSSGHWLGFTAGDVGSGAVEVPSQFVGATDAAPASLPTTTREGYAFDGWFEGGMEGGIVSYGGRVTDERGTVLDPAALKAMLSEVDVELYAKWTGAATTYRVLIWHENPDDEGYSYQGAATIGDEAGERAVSGEMTGVTQMPAVEGFTLQDIEQAVIAGDGSTVVHALYDRNEYSIRFHDGRYSSSPVIDGLTITAKYGADVQNRWPTPTPETAYTSSWYTLPYDDPAFEYTYVNGISTMPLDGADFYLKNTRGMDFSTVFMIQDIDGSNNFTTYMTQLFSAARAPATTPDDYMPVKGFMVNAASGDDADEIAANPVGDPAATHDPAFETSTPVHTDYEDLPEVADEYGTDRFTSHFYYLRCQYDIVFEENGGPEVADVEGVYYESPLAGLAPADYVAGETAYVEPNGETFEFAGWYANSELLGEPFDFASATMPAGNVVLYAKWEPVEYLVQVDPAGGEFTDDGQSTYFWVGHGDTVGYIGAERHYVADDDGTHVYDYEAYQADDDGFGNADYVVAQPGEPGQRYSYSQDAYSLFGWYKVDDGARGLSPFDFGEPITEDTSIVARWQAAGRYDIAYDPTVDVAGVTVTGDIDTTLDAGYADLSPTVVMNTPANIEASDGDEYAFLGWQVVESFDAGAGVLVDALYREGDAFVVDSELARDNTIFLQAVYEETADDPADPAPPADTVDPTPPTDSTDPTEPADPGASADPGDSDTVDDPADPATSADQDDGEDAESDGEEARQATGDASGLPQTDDAMQLVVFALVDLALIAIVVALVARALRRYHSREE